MWMMSSGRKQQWKMQNNWKKAVIETSGETVLMHKVYVTVQYYSMIL